jgi:hypothetical protein
VGGGVDEVAHQGGDAEEGGQRQPVLRVGHGQPVKGRREEPVGGQEAAHCGEKRRPASADGGRGHHQRQEQDEHGRQRHRVPQIRQQQGEERDAGDGRQPAETPPAGWQGRQSPPAWCPRRPARLQTRLLGDDVDVDRSRQPHDPVDDRSTGEFAPT